MIYLGSFSKTFAPGLRVGWAVAPHGIREKLVLAAEASGAVPAGVQPDGGVGVPRRATPGWTRSRCSASSTASGATPCSTRMATRCRPGTTWTVPAGGFYSWVTLPDGLDATGDAAPGGHRPGRVRARDRRSSPAPSKPLGRRSLRLSYCYPEPERIREGVRRLAGVVEEELDLVADLRPRARSAGLDHGGRDGPRPSDVPGPETA